MLLRDALIARRSTLKVMWVLRIFLWWGISNTTWNSFQLIVICAIRIRKISSVRDSLRNQSILMRLNLVRYGMANWGTWRIIFFIVIRRRILNCRLRSSVATRCMDVVRVSIVWLLRTTTNRPNASIDGNDAHSACCCFSRWIGCIIARRNSTK